MIRRCRCYKSVIFDGSFLLSMFIPIPNSGWSRSRIYSTGWSLDYPVSY